MTRALQYMGSVLTEAETRISFVQRGNGQTETVQTKLLDFVRDFKFSGLEPGTKMQDIAIQKVFCILAWSDKILIANFLQASLIPPEQKPLCKSAGFHWVLHK